MVRILACVGVQIHPSVISRLLQLVFLEAATPLTNMHYLGASHGAMYSAEQNLDRFHPEVIARNKCSTPVKNLFISGRMCGFI